MHAELQTKGFKGFMFAWEEHKLKHQSSSFPLRIVVIWIACQREQCNKWASGIDFHLVLPKHFSLTNINCLLSAREFDGPDIEHYNELAF